MFNFIRKLFGTAQDRLVNRYSKVVAKVNEFDEKFKNLSDDELKAKTDEFKKQSRQKMRIAGRT